MKKAIASMRVILLTGDVGSSAAAIIGNSQAGGLPALHQRVRKREAEVAQLILQVGSLQTDVAALKSAVGALKSVNAGNRTSRTPQPSGTTSNYAYDATYELTGVTQGSTTTESYTYDSVGNRLSSLGVSPYNVPLFADRNRSYITRSCHSGCHSLSQ